MSLTALSLAESDSLDIGGAHSGNLARDKTVLLLHIQHTYLQQICFFSFLLSKLTLTHVYGPLATNQTHIQ